MQLTSRELATVLAALRYWQQRQADSLDVQEQPAVPLDFHGCWDVATDGGTLEPLSVTEIDGLCLRINT